MLVLIQTAFLIFTHKSTCYAQNTACRAQLQCVSALIRTRCGSSRSCAASIQRTKAWPSGLPLTDRAARTICKSTICRSRSQDGTHVIASVRRTFSEETEQKAMKEHTKRPNLLFWPFFISFWSVFSALYRSVSYHMYGKMHKLRTENSAEYTFNG